MAPQTLRAWAPAAAAGVLLATVVVAGAVRSGDAADGVTPVDTVVTVPTTTMALAADRTGGVPAVEEVVALTRTLGPGVSGTDVERVQRRLIALAFDPGEVDGVYGTRTLQAVWAFEKLVMGVPREQARGRVTPEVWDRMQRAVDIRPRRPEAPSENHTEIYLPEQVLVVFHDRRPVLVTHISSGDGEEWCEEVTISPGELGNERGTEPLKEGVCGRSVTPGGVFRYYRRVEGRRESQLGGLYNPVYFNFGIAVHGAHEVPAFPASHGCIRLPMHISDYYQSLVTWGRTTGDVVYVWDGVKEPEEYGAQPPVWNWSDPDYSTTTTSSSTTSTLPTTTVVSTSTTTTVPDTPSATSTTQPAEAELDPDTDDDSALQDGE
jgi:hypothetical protein